MKSVSSGVSVCQVIPEYPCIYCKMGLHVVCKYNPVIGAVRLSGCCIRAVVYQPVIFFTAHGTCFLFIKIRAVSVQIAHDYEVVLIRAGFPYIVNDCGQGIDFFGGFFRVGMDTSVKPKVSSRSSKDAM
ncbi:MULTISPECIES: hypothetical protein [unclassified Methanosarcina]|uniref:hypothetical protein n=1 Tax=unclassified Methanosarcina TaxID=2644672 RepID=UPI000ABA9D2F|nr:MULTISPECIES: hypothetical protein [unclassified Methanosarcina]